MSEQEKEPCPGNGTCCNRPLFDRTMFPCDRIKQLEAELDRLREQSEAYLKAANQSGLQMAQAMDEVDRLRGLIGMDQDEQGAALHQPRKTTVMANVIRKQEAELDRLRGLLGEVESATRYSSGMGFREANHNLVERIRQALGEDGK